MLRCAGIKYIACYHCGGALCISSLTRRGLAWLSEDTVSEYISIIVGLIGMIYSFILLLTHLDFLMPFIALNKSCVYSRKEVLEALGQLAAELSLL